MDSNVKSAPSKHSRDAQNVRPYGIVLKNVKLEIGLNTKYHATE
jgi:hypothetical protein